MFCLCRKCVLTSYTGECCPTTEEETVLIGTWLMKEVRLAVENGYDFIEIYVLFVYSHQIRSLNFSRRSVWQAIYTGYTEWLRSPIDEE